MLHKQQCWVRGMATAMSLKVNSKRTAGHSVPTSHSKDTRIRSEEGVRPDTPLGGQASKVAFLYGAIHRARIAA